MRHINHRHGLPVCYITPSRSAIGTLAVGWQAVILLLVSGAASEVRHWRSGPQVRGGQWALQNGSVDRQIKSVAENLGYLGRGNRPQWSYHSL